jgi:hypothetical protein
MAPPRKYSTTELAHALAVAPSVVAACRLTGMAQGAMRKRAKTDKGLRRVYAKCLARGIAQAGRHYTRPQLRAATQADWEAFARGVSDAELRSKVSKARDAGKLGRKP